MKLNLIWSRLGRDYLLFPILLLVALSLRLPPGLFLAAFLVFLFLYWRTFRTQVPYYSARLPTWRAVEKALPEREGLRFINIGCGFGGLVPYLAQRQPSGRFFSIEIAPLPWLIGRLRAHMANSVAQFVRSDYRSLDFSGYDAVFAYLSLVAMPDLWEKARDEMCLSSLLFSCEFPVEGIPSDEVIVPEGGDPVLYLWRL